MFSGRVNKDAGAVDALDKADLRAAYERGRRDERAARKRRPLLMTLTFGLAAVGAILLGMAATSGSFGRAGSVVDAQLSQTVDQAGLRLHAAARDARQRLRDAGRQARSHLETNG
jgi:hypothetical protein